MDAGAFSPAFVSFVNHSRRWTDLKFFLLPPISPPQPCEVTESHWPEVSRLSFTPKPGLDLTGFSWLLAWLPFNKEAKLALLKSSFLKGPPVK